MKKTIAVFACALALSACGNQSSASNDQSSNSQSSNDQSSSQTANQASQSGSSASTGATQSSDQSKNASGSDQDKSGQFASEQAKRSYALGMDIGNSLKNLPIKVDLDELTQGVQDVVNGKQTRLSEKQQHTVMQAMVSEMQASEKKKEQQTAEANLKAGQKFLAENKKKPGVKTLKDGLQYKVLKQGSGPQPDANDSVTVNYTGKLIDGTVFDSSEKRGKPVTFPVNAVIPGWTEALQLMHAGGEYRLFIPPKLAYGKRGAGSKIGPNETLIFDVKLISIDKNKGSGSNESGSSANAGSDNGSGDNSGGAANDSSSGGADAGADKSGAAGSGKATGTDSAGASTNSGGSDSGN